MRPALLALLVAATAAHAAPYKPVHPEATGDELLALARARIAERTGDLLQAHGFYRTALAVAKHANTYWNLADLERRMEKYQEAVRSFQEYKKLASTDAERASADTEIAAIQTTPMRLALSGHPTEETLVFVDGVRKGTAPYVATFATAGGHVVDILSASRYEHRNIDVRLATSDDHRLRDLASGRSGNVILAGSAAMSMMVQWREGEHALQFPGRFTLPPGTYETQLGDSDRYACDKLEFTVPKKGTVFVFVAAPQRNQDGCTKATVTTQVVSL